MDPMSTIGELRNGAGVPVSLHRCDYCGASFTLTPATDDAWGLGCLDWNCPSYDPNRDVDLLWNRVRRAP